jgi:hypothetical protein
MNELPVARSRAQRIADTRRRLTEDIDAWIASADRETGEGYLVPLCFWWDGETILISTMTDSITGRNLRHNPRAEFSLDGTRDVILIRSTVETLTVDQLRPGEADKFAEYTRFEPRNEPTDHYYFRLTPYRIQAWREVNELKGRTIFRDGTWLV